MSGLVCVLLVTGFPVTMLVTLLGMQRVEQMIDVRPREATIAPPEGPPEARGAAGVLTGTDVLSEADVASEADAPGASPRSDPYPSDPYPSEPVRPAGPLTPVAPTVSAVNAPAGQIESRG